MMTFEEQYRQYRSVHHEFSVTYALVHRSMMDFKTQPEEFVETIIPQLEMLSKKFPEGAADIASNGDYQTLFYFTSNFNQFNTHIHKLFEQYRAVDKASGVYMRKVFRLKETTEHSQVDSSYEYIQLIPEITELVTSLKDIKEKTYQAERSLKLLQSDWLALKNKLR